MPTFLEIKHYLINNWAIVCILALVISLGIGVRFLLVEKHFAHIDDIGVAERILERQEYMSTIEERFEDWKVEVFNGEKGSSVESIARTLDEMSILKEVAYFSLWWRNFLHAVPSGWTYAPGQFYLTNILINKDQSYSDIKFWGRMPSLIFNIAAMGLLIIFYFQLSENKRAIKYSVVGVAMLSFSWENIIYSAQMESYAISTFAMVFMFLHLLHIIKYPIISNKKTFLRGMILAIPGLLQYQALIFVLPLYVAILWYIKSKVSLVDLVRSSLIAMLGFLSIFLIFIWPYLKNSTHRGITWNAGTDGQFVLDPNWSDGAYSFFSEIFNFFLINIPEVVEAMLSPVAYYTEGQSYLGWLLLVLSLVGLISIFLSNNPTKKVVAIFISTSLIFWVILLFFQLFPLSPTRHSIVLGFIFIILIVEGVFAFERALIKVSWLNHHIGGLSFIPLCFVLIWSALFLTTASFAFGNRNDPFSEADIYRTLNRDEVDVIVVFDSTEHLHLMSSIISKYPALNANAWTVDGLKNVSNFGLDDEHLVGNKYLRIAVISSWGCFNLQDERSIELINGVILNRYNLNSKDIQSSIIEQICTKSNVEVEWSTRTSNGRNTFNYSVIELLSLE